MQSFIQENPMYVLAFLLFTMNKVNCVKVKFIVVEKYIQNTINY